MRRFKLMEVWQCGIKCWPLCLQPLRDVHWIRLKWKSNTLHISNTLGHRFINHKLGIWVESVATSRCSSGSSQRHLLKMNWHVRLQRCNLWSHHDQFRLLLPDILLWLFLRRGLWSRGVLKMLLFFSYSTVCHNVVNPQRTSNPQWRTYKGWKFNSQWLWSPLKTPCSRCSRFESPWPFG